MLNYAFLLCRWLQHVCVNVQVENEPVNVSWSAFHASCELEENATEKSCATSHLLPLFQEDAATVAMIRHSMDIIMKVTELTVPGQTPVIEGDQPLFAIAKSIQWKWPLEYGESKLVIMFGGLHIELTALKILGDLLEGSGWTSALVQAGVATAGTADSFLKASHITRTRHAHQVTASAMYQALNEAYQDYVSSVEPDTETKNMEDWCTEQQKNQPMFMFWFTVLKLQLTVLVFIKSIRTGDFHLYIHSLTKIVHWCFALDHYNYSRWISVHLRDMVSLSQMHPHIYTEFIKGHFTVKKTSHVFSNIAIDQAHEQNNAVVKGDGGAVGLTESPAALQRWMVCGPEMARLLNDFDMSINQAQSTPDVRHHEQRPAVQKTFLEDVKALKSTFDEYGNPFLETGSELLVLDTHDIAEKSVVDTLYHIEELGQKQYDTFVKERLVEKTKPLDDPIKKNQLHIFSTPKTRKKTKTQEVISTLKTDRNLFSRLYIGCQVRDSNLEEFFSHENQPFPPSLSDSGKLRLGTKSDIIHCLQDGIIIPHASPTSEVVVLDGAVIVNILKPGSAKTFGEYAQDIFLPYVRSQLERSQRVDIVWDTYKDNSLKDQAHNKRGTGNRRRVEANNPVPQNWGDFLRNTENKKELFAFLSRIVITILTEKKIISTLDNDVVCNQPYNTKGLSPCSHEEADSRMMVHVQDASRQYNTVLIRTVDSDVVVLAVFVFPQLTIPLAALWIAFGTGKHFHFIPVHEICASLGPPKCFALPIFHAFTGCDTVSSFAGKGKRSAWETWNLNPQITTVFTTLMEQPQQSVVHDNISPIERFVVLMYDKTSSCDHVNEARLQLFAQKGRDINNIPPSQGALLQHVKRAVYQAGYCWSQTLKLIMELPQPEGWGWTATEEGQWEVIWSNLPEVSKVSKELTRCGCIKGCRGNCKCRKAKLTCTAMCKCGGSC